MKKTKALINRTDKTNLNFKTVFSLPVGTLILKTFYNTEKSNVNTLILMMYVVKEKKNSNFKKIYCVNFQTLRRMINELMSL